MAGDGESTGRSEPSDDELARTATSAGTTPTRSASTSLGATLGRYRLEHELGAGGMGVVHAAFDPDLERRVALKVLHTSDSPEARQRLLREARAMARLTHENVAVVHEVGTANGRDYVAMELIDGETLADWLKQPRSEREIVGAFVAAGRGLAAAHAAGLVHRDFKPRNVLRRKDGRIVVTDFGLARGVEADGEGSAEIALETTMRISEKRIETSSLSGLTATGSVLGTPAYMAPEQWRGKTVGPAADQFAFCVALWEALTGERPFKGATLEALEHAVTQAPRELDDDKLPRRLRAALRRGLAADPRDRWPSMDALLVRITPGASRPGVALIIASGAVVVAAGVYALVGQDDAAGARCAPARDVAAIWSPAQAAKLRAAGYTRSVALFDAQVARFREVHDRVCKLDAQTRDIRVGCLDGVLARLELAVGNVSVLPSDVKSTLGENLVSPTVCELPRPPRLLRAISPELVRVTRANLERSARDDGAEDNDELGADEAASLLKLAGDEPCALATARLVTAAGAKTTAERDRELAEAAGTAQRCGDDRILFEAAALAAAMALARFGPESEVEAKLKHAALLAEPVMQPDVEASLELLQAAAAVRTGSSDEAVRRAERAATLYAENGHAESEITARMTALSFRRLSGSPTRHVPPADELAELTRLRERAARELGETHAQVRVLDRNLAQWQFSTGDVTGATQAFEALHRPRPVDNAIVMRGTVVDETGRPVAGATVFTAPSMAGNAVTAAMATGGRRSAVTAADGTFEIAEADPAGVVVAQLADRRSAAQPVADQVRVALAPTSRLAGSVELHGHSPSSVSITLLPKTQARSLSYALSAPVQPDGTFVLDGVPRGRVTIQVHAGRALSTAVSTTELDVNRSVIDGVRLEVRASSRELHVLVRSTVGSPVANTQVFVMPGRVESSTVAGLIELAKDTSSAIGRPLKSEDVPSHVVQAGKSDDLYARIENVPAGEISACAIGLPPNIGDDLLMRVLREPKNLERIAMPCVPVTADGDVVVVEVPPWPRFD
jgi:predicted Ser/Thr protein kinase